ncbi:MAG: archaemetzincin [Pirellulales bacterium]
MFSGATLVTGCGSEAAPPKDTGKLKPDALRRAMAKIAPLHEKKKIPQPGDWLDRFGEQEKGQTFDEYLKTGRRIGQVYPKLYLQPLGTFDSTGDELLKTVAEAMTCFFGLPTDLLKTRGLDDWPDDAERVNARTGKRQILSTYVLDPVLKRIRPRDAAAILGLTNEDLWPGEGWNYVFGQASLDERVGIWSTARFGDPQGDDAERKRFVRRTLKVALHETGHMFGIPHCIAYECGMNGANHLEEGDRQPLEYCPECQAKLWWTNDYDPQTRSKKLAEFAEKHHLEDEAKSWKATVETLSQ